jgi:hypothetical protein
LKVKLENHYFPIVLSWVLLVGLIISGGYVIYFRQYEWVVILFTIFTSISFTTKYLMQINTHEKIIVDSFEILWFDLKREEYRFQQLKGIRLDKERHSYTANSRARTAQTDFNEYIGILEFDNQSIEIARDVSYKSFADEMQRVAQELSIPIHRSF